MKVSNRYVLIITLLCSFTLQAQDRDVVWQHGLGGTQDFWARTANSFANSRRIESIAVSADTDNGVRDMASDIIAETNVRSLTDRTIGIGHSMGGVALREIGSVTSPGKIGGLVTVGAPLNGAQIANALIDGRVNDYIENGIRELLKGPRRNFFTGSFIIVNGVKRAFTGRNLQEVLLERIDNEGFLSRTAANASVRDLAVGSSYNTAATIRGFTKPNISIYGNENRPVHYRLASTSIFDNDVLLPNVINRAEGIYNGFYVASFVAIFSPTAAWRRAGWKAGRDYLRNNSETGWNNLIGATRTEEIESCYMTFTCDNSWYYPNCTNGNFNSGCSSCWREVCETVTRVYNEPSDGLIHQSSQIGARTLAVNSRWSPDRTFEALGANHNEYDSHPGTRIAITRVFEANLSGVDIFFKVGTR